MLRKDQANDIFIGQAVKTLDNFKTCNKHAKPITG